MYIMFFFFSFLEKKFNSTSEWKHISNIMGYYMVWTFSTILKTLNVITTWNFIKILGKCWHGTALSCHFHEKIFIYRNKNCKITESSNKAQPHISGSQSRLCNMWYHSIYHFLWYPIIFKPLYNKLKNLLHVILAKANTRNDVNLFLVSSVSAFDNYSKNKQY